ncbi:MAG: 2-hydroxyacyl-CoA dehydratase [Chloroflexota bacterium]|nr:MAG: 2-hydroxyacyl-CoA dehydratase [Chloroflexota bacterium]
MQEDVMEFADIVRRPYAAIASAKEKSGKCAIGCFPMYVPHEVVDAAWMLPVDIYGGSGGMTVAAEYFESINCYPMRNAFELLLTGQLSVLDGAIFGTTCNAAKSGGDIWRSLRVLPHFHQLTLPNRVRGAHALEYFQQQIERLCESLAVWGGRTIGREELAASIRRYNHSRNLLEQLAEISQQHPEMLTPQDFTIVRAAGSFMLRSDYVSLLTRLLADIAAKTSDSEEEWVGLALVGNPCDMPLFELLSIIHEAGAVVVADETTSGRRAWVKVSERLEPIAALARRYLDMPPCPTQCDDNMDAQYEYLLGLATTGRALGVVFVRPLYCDPAGMVYPVLANRLSAANVPTLRLDLDGREGARGQVRTRLQAFVEMVRR